ncbi:MAG: large conductance mechanosensitive channel protein MscL [Thermomicrobiales bacterium]|nr:large conductance mechanosensitive channel protein MscL [Thermomicrobiales bacterium]
MKGILDEFKAFILQGNVVMLAVAVIIGAAFTDIVTNVSEAIIMPLIAAIGGQPDFNGIGFTINNSFFNIGLLINAIINFLIIAAIVFFLIVKPMNMLLAKTKKEETVADPTTTTCPYCQSEISLAATRCPACTSELAPQAAV